MSNSQRTKFQIDSNERIEPISICTKRKIFLSAGGMVLQTNMSDILARIDDQNRLVKQEAGLSAAPAAVVHQLKSMNLPQQFKDMKLPDLPQAIKVK